MTRSRRATLSGRDCPRGHDKSELGPAARGTPHADRAAVRFDQALDDVEAETGTAPALAAPEPAEHPRCDLRGDALTLVAHGDGGRVGRAEADGHRRRRLAVHPCRFHHDRYDTSAVPDGILHEVA